MSVPLRNARLDTAELAAAVAAAGTSLPPAIVCNAHITGLAVARSLARRGVPVIGLDREPYGVGLASNALVAAAVCHDPIAREGDFVEDLRTIGRALGRPAVFFGCMDEWVLAASAHRADLDDVLVFPFAADRTVQRVLDKSVLYPEAVAAGIPIPRTVDTRRSDDAQAIAAVGLPAVLKPAAKRPFYDAFGANLFVVETETEFARRRAEGAAFGMLAQEVLPATAADYVSVAVALAPGGEVLGTLVGQRLEISPPGYGTSCLVRALERSDLEAQAVAILRRFGYHGIAEVEFLRDPRDGVFKLLDVNTRPWKWIGLPIAAGVDLPWLVYAATLGLPVEPVAPAARRTDLLWVSLKDYLPLRAAGQTMQPGDPIGRERWLDLLAGRQGEQIVEAIWDLSDPEPMYRAIQASFGVHRYSCPC
jgi:predicted ATP-grasp superfamily ATP-dependent carboligase